MRFDYSILDNTEKAGYALLSLYKEHGFAKYRMSRFEDYDLYSGNRDYLPSENIITFTDTNGKLMALKPDVTLSIIRNVKDAPSELRKLSYMENVYRVPRSGGTFSEILQAGLECIGAVDTQCICEVLTLADASISMSEADHMLVISHLDILSAYIAGMSDDDEVRRLILKCAGDKNLHSISDICARYGIADERFAPLRELLKLSGKPSEVIPRLRAMSSSMDIAAEIDLLEEVITASGISEDHLNVDFSTVSDLKYYNGIVFRGFIDGIPGSVLSGGQYDRLMERMELKSKAIGFAVYLDMMQRI